ncbi:hypothetical protein SBDP1_850094 [Syntrophobacter sp. SbD1]|nr:hypothetical protein SBDP1_850094 [Syntrophobacter sp. SbD1]
MDDSDPRPPNASDRHAMQSPSALHNVTLFRDAGEHASQSESVRRPQSVDCSPVLLHLLDVLDGGLAFNCTTLIHVACRIAPPTAVALIFALSIFFN